MHSANCQGTLRKSLKAISVSHKEETMAVKDYIDTNDFTKEELLDMIELARSMKP